jgi:nitronate monooxygenase
MGAEVSQVPLVVAPMAGGPTTPALVAASLDAGAFAFLAAGYRSAADVERELAAVRTATGRPVGVNLFVPTLDDADPKAIAAYAARIGADAADARWSDDDWDAKLELVLRERPAVASFTFGCPPSGVVEALHARDVDVWCTVTSAAEARVAANAGADALAVQGVEAGGHQGSYDDTDEEPRPLLDLLREVAAAVELPLVGAGGVSDAARVRAVLDAGAVAAQVGTALLLCPEAGTSAPHRAALRGDAPTALTRAFSGRRARGIVNAFMRDHDAHAPRGYPQVHYLTAPLRAAAREAGDADRINLWAGTAYPTAREEPAATVIRRLVELV